MWSWSLGGRAPQSSRDIMVTLHAVLSVAKKTYVIQVKQRFVKYYMNVQINEKHSLSKFRSTVPIFGKFMIVDHMNAMYMQRDDV